MAFQRPGMSDFTGVFGDNQGISVDADSAIHDGNSARCRSCCATQPDAAGGAGGRRYPIVPPSITNSVQHVRLEPPDAVHAVVHRSAGSASSASDTAFEVRYVGSRHRQDWETVNLNEINITTNGFLNEFRQGAGEPAGQHRRRPRRDVRLHGRAGHVAAADLPGVLQRAAARQRRQRGGLHGHQLDQRDVPRLPGGAEPEPVRASRRHATRPTASSATRRSAPTRVAAGLPANFFLANPDVLGGAQPRRRNCAAARAPTRCRSSSASASRTASRSTPATPGATRSCSSATASASRSRRSAGRPGRQRAARVQGQLASTSCRSARTSKWGGNVERLPRRAASAAGRSTASAASRPARCSTSATSAWSA